MFRLTLLLGAAIFLVLLIGGEDRGQMRPGLAAADRLPPPAVVRVAADPAPATVVEEQPADIAPATEPVVVTSAAPAPDARAEPPAVEDTPEVFSLATFADTTDTASAGPAVALPTEQAGDAPLVAEAVATPPTAEQAGDAGAVVIVDAQSVNVRSGPGTEFSVLTRLSQGEAVRQIGDAGNGWALVLIEGDGVEGYVSMRYLTAP
jgi:hypothetical protein